MISFQKKKDIGCEAFGFFIFLDKGAEAKMKKWIEKTHESFQALIPCEKPKSNDNLKKFKIEKKRGRE